MSTAITEKGASPATDLSPAGQATELRQPLLWLGVILLVGLGLRCWGLTGPLEQDEFALIYPVVQRQGLQPGDMAMSDEPLGPVANWQEVQARSVLPLGVRNPVPLYNYLLYAL